MRRREEGIGYLKNALNTIGDGKKFLRMIYNCSISTSMLASILCVKKACLDHVLELKIDNIRFAGYAKQVQSNNIF